MSVTYWIGVAAKDHVMVGVEGGFCQLGHGKHLPVKAFKKGDWLTYYAPKTQLNGGETVQGFVAIGQVLDDAPYQVEVNESFSPWRRDIDYRDVETVSIRPLLEQFSFINDPKHWGIQFRRSVFKVGYGDFKLIADAMNVDV